MMLQALVNAARELLRDCQRVVRPMQPPAAPLRQEVRTPRLYGPLRRILVTDGVAHTLFEDYAAHRRAARGENETGWLLLGLREAEEAVVLATLPAGAEYDAGVGHVRFNSSGQAVASRIVRQHDRRLTILGVVHTHPGTLRHPSDGDFRGDSQWVERLRGREGIFAIGTADAPADAGPMFAYQPKPHVQCLGALRFSWYSLRRGDSQYRPAPMEVTIGPDLARPLHPLWAALEAHADRIERLFRQQVGLRFEVVQDEHGPGLVLVVPLADSGDAIRVLIRSKEVRYYVVRGGILLEVDHRDDCVDRGTYLLLAELASRS
jgi:proteasome lid subunit RPN8/RPN11